MSRIPNVVYNHYIRSSTQCGLTKQENWESKKAQYGVVFACLDGYAIIPAEEYESLLEATKN